MEVGECSFEVKCNFHWSIQSPIPPPRQQSLCGFEKMSIYLLSFSPVRAELKDSCPLDVFTWDPNHLSAPNPQLRYTVFKLTALSLQLVPAESALERPTNPHMKPEEATCCSNSWPQCSLCQTHIYLSLISNSFIICFGSKCLILTTMIITVELLCHCLSRSLRLTF